MFMFHQYFKQAFQQGFQSLILKAVKTAAYGLVILLAIYAFARFFDKSLGGIYDGVRAPYIQVPGSDSATIRWNTKRPHPGVVKIGESHGSLNRVFVETKADDEHEVRLTGLKPNTKYYYSVGTQNARIYAGKDYWFKTAPDSVQSKTSTTRFWVTGDQGQAGMIQSQVRDAMLAWTQKNPLEGQSNLDFWLTTGDNAYRSGTNKQFQQNFFNPYEDILRNTPVWPVYGNHDARRWSFFNIFSFPEKGESGGIASGTEKYYSFDYGNLHVVVLDTQTSRLQKNSKMLRWLEKDLTATKQKWIVVAFHHPPYTKGSHNSDNLADSFNRMRNVRENVLPVLEKGGVDVVLSGHSHMYERSWFMKCHYDDSHTFNENHIVATKDKQKQIGANYHKKNSGTIYITIGSSARLDKGELNHPAMPVSLHKSGSVVFDIHDSKLTANFISRTGEVADDFSIVKDGDGEAVAFWQCF